MVMGRNSSAQAKCVHSRSQLYSNAKFFIEIESICIYTVPCKSIHIPSFCSCNYFKLLTEKQGGRCQTKAEPEGRGLGHALRTAGRWWAGHWV